MNFKPSVRLFTSCHLVYCHSREENLYFIDINQPLDWVRGISNEHTRTYSNIYSKTYD